MPEDIRLAKGEDMDALKETVDAHIGDDYIHVKTAIQIGILDFTLFPDAPEFYATYLMANIKNHQIYSSKLRLSVLDLTHIDLATKEDRLFHIDYWASLFKATTWEEIKMLAQKDSLIKEASDTILQLSQDEQIRQRCEARADYLFWQRVEEEYKKELEEKYQKVLSEKQQLEKENLEKIARIKELEAQLAIKES